MGKYQVITETTGYGTPAQLLDGGEVSTANSVIVNCKQGDAFLEENLIETAKGFMKFMVDGEVFSVPVAAVGYVGDDVAKDLGEFEEEAGLGWEVEKSEEKPTNRASRKIRTRRNERGQYDHFDEVTGTNWKVFLKMSDEGRPLHWAFRNDATEEEGGFTRSKKDAIDALDLYLTTRRFDPHVGWTAK